MRTQSRYVKDTSDEESLSESELHDNASQDSFWWTTVQVGRERDLIFNQVRIYLKRHFDQEMKTEAVVQLWNTPIAVLHTTQG